MEDKTLRIKFSWLVKLTVRSAKNCPLKNLCNAVFLKGGKNSAIIFWTILLHPLVRYVPAAKSSGTIKVINLNLYIFVPWVESIYNFVGKLLVTILLKGNVANAHQTLLVSRTELNLSFIAT